MAKWRKTMNKWKKLMKTWKKRDGLKTRMPDATEIMKIVQNMTHLECPIYAWKKFRMIFLVLDFFYDWMFFYIYNSDGLKTRMPDATEIMKRVQNMTHLECPTYARKKFRMIFFCFFFVMMEAFQVHVMIISLHPIFTGISIIHSLGTLFHPPYLGDILSDAWKSKWYITH